MGAISHKRIRQSREHFRVTGERQPFDAADEAATKRKRRHAAERLRQSVTVEEAAALLAVPRGVLDRMEAGRIAGIEALGRVAEREDAGQMRAHKLLCVLLRHDPETGWHYVSCLHAAAARKERWAEQWIVATVWELDRAGEHETAARVCLPGLSAVKPLAKRGSGAPPDPESDWLISIAVDWAKWEWSTMEGISESKAEAEAIGEVAGFLTGTKARNKGESTIRDAVMRHRERFSLGP